MNKNKSIGYLCVVVSALFWGSIPIFTRLLYKMGSTPQLVSSIRGYISALIMIIIFIANGTFKKISIKEIPFYFLYGAIAIGGCFVSYATAINMLSTAMAAVLLYTGPTFVNIINRIFYKKPITKVKVVALLLSFAGCFLVLRVYDIAEFKSNIVGILIGLLSGLCYSMTTVIGEKAKKYHDGKTNGGLILILGSFVFLFLEPPGQIVIQNSEQWEYYVGLAVIATIIPYILYLSGIERGIDGGTASIVATIEPVAAIVFGVLIFNDKLEFLQVMGIVIVLIGITLPVLNDKVIQQL